MWQQGGSANKMKYEAAQKWIEDLNRKGYAGYSDWRLPTLEEAMSMMDPKQLNGDLYIDPKFDSRQRWIWTSDPYPGAAAQWVAYFDGGRCRNDDLDFYDRGYVRAVRFGQSDKSD